MIHNVLSLALLTVPQVRADVYPAPARLDAIEYDLVLAPGADPAQIALRFDGDVRLDARGDLLVRRRNGSELRHSAPVTYQVIGGSRSFVESRFRIRRDGAVGFEVAAHDRTHALVIDPVVTASRYLPSLVAGFAADDSGNAYVSVSGTNIVNKVNPQGVVLSSTVPFPENASPVERLAVDSTGNVYFATAAACPPGASVIGSVPGNEIVVAKLNPDLTTRAYTLCIRPGPSNVVGQIVADRTGSLYVSGTTTSNSFPATGNFGSLVSGLPHLFVIRVNPQGTNLVYSIVTGNEIGSPFLAVDNSGNAWVCGSTGPQFEPRQAFLSQYEGGASDAFLLKILPDGSNIPFATFLGGVEANGVAVDGFGNPVVAATSPNLPIAGAGSFANSGNDIYLGKFSPDGQQLLIGTYVPGTTGSGSLTKLTGRASDFYLTGATGSGSFPAINAIPGIGGGTDAFIVKFDSQLRRVLSTRFGGSSGEVFPEIAAADSRAVLMFRTQSADLPARVNSISGAQTGAVAFISEAADMGIQVTRTGNQHRVTVTNFGQDNTTAVTVRGILPSNSITGTDITCSVKNVLNSGHLNCSLGTIFKNGSVTFNVTTSNATNGTFTVDSALNDPNSGNNSN
ncbi:MAG: hypothetical protein U0Q16_36030 [Bryobacteraceae bacterium]